MKILALTDNTTIRQLQLLLEPHHITLDIINTIAIEPLPIPKENFLETFDIAIFTSPNAVKHSQDFLASHKPHWQWLAIGAATQQALQKFTSHDIHSPTLANSENLLALPLLQDVKNKKILIITGQGGRELLAQTLQKRGAKVNIMACYKRALPARLAINFEKTWQNQCANLILATSQTSLLNLQQVLPASLWQELCRTPLLVSSDRLVACAKELTFTHVAKANAMKAEALLSSILTMGN